MTDPSEDELTRLASEELRKEAVRGKQRSDTMGVAGWMRPKMTPNKQFLRNTLTGAVWQRKRDLKTTGRQDTQTKGGSTGQGTTAGGENQNMSHPANGRHLMKRNHLRTEQKSDMKDRVEDRSKRLKHSPQVNGHSLEVKTKSRSSTSKS